MAGRYLSLLEQRACYCGGAHANVSKDFRAYRIDNTHGPTLTGIYLREIFGEGVIFEALRNDKVVKAALVESQKGAPTNLDGLLQALNGQSVDTGSCRYMFDEDLLNRFAFFDVQGDRVAVRISLPYDTESCRGSTAQIGIWLPVPAELRNDLFAAKKRTAGFVMADAERVSKGRQTGVSASDPPR
jgi:hypothetical protein